MNLSLETYAIAVGLIFAVSVLFSMIGLGGGMLDVPIFKWVGLPLKAVAIPLGLLLNGITTFSAFLRYAREGLVDFKGGSPAAIGALVLAPVGAWSVQFVSREALLGLFAVAVVIAGLRTLLTSGRAEPKAKMPLGRRMVIGAVGGLRRILGGAAWRLTLGQGDITR